MTKLKTNFQENVKRLLKSERISQRELAKRLGVSDAAVSELLNGNYSPSLDYVERIAKALNQTNFSLLVPTTPEVISDLSSTAS